MTLRKIGRKIGVEEELFLVDPETELITGVSHRALRAHEALDLATRGSSSDPRYRDVEQELFLQQIETATTPWVARDDVRAELVRCRRAAGQAAHAAGAVAVAVGTPVLVDVDAQVTPKPRYRRIAAEFGELSRQSVVCGMHVHVDIADDAEGVGVIDRLRPWLPVLLAISVNSPFWRGADTGHASWRSRVWSAWPTAGPAEPFRDAEGYRAAADGFINAGAALDPGMLYFDARLAERYSTIELRVADVCTEVDDAALVAMLARSLVETAARDWAAGRPLPAWRTDLLRAAQWRAARFGVAADLVHPVTRQLATPRTVFAALLDHTRDALEEYGDRAAVEAAFEQLLARGSGASRQRSVFEAHGDLHAVVADLRQRTEASWSHD